MRICFVSTARKWGGGERLLASLVGGIADLGQDVALVARRDTPLARWGREQSQLPLLELPGRGRDPLSLWRLRRWLVENRFDLLLLNDPHAITSGGVATLGLPTKKVGMRHTIFPVNSAWKHNRLLDHVICVAEAAQRECRQAGIDPARTSVVYAGLEQPQVDPTNVARLRAMFHNAAGHQTDSHLLALGSLLPVKGFDTIIRALARGVAAGRRWRLWLAGEGQQREALETLADSLGIAERVHFLGFRKDIGDLLTAADLLVSASHFEGLSLVLVEAMLAGCPLVATPVGGNREALCVDEAGGSPYAITFTPGDVRGLVGALQQGLEPEASQRRAAAAQQWANESFSVRHMAGQHLQIYRQLVGGESSQEIASRRRRRAA